MVKITSDFILSNPAYIPSLVQLHIAKFFQASEIRAALLKTPIDSKAVEQMTNKYHDEITAQWEKNTKSYKQCLSHIGQCTVADMASISQDYMFYLVNEKKNIKEDGDISLELFTKFVEQSLKKDPNRVAFLSVINLAEIFNVFDIDKDGKLNFL